MVGRGGRAFLRCEEQSCAGVGNSWLFLGAVVILVTYCDVSRAGVLTTGECNFSDARFRCVRVTIDPQPLEAGRMEPTGEISAVI